MKKCQILAILFLFLLMQGCNFPGFAETPLPPPVTRSPSASLETLAAEIPTGTPTGLSTLSLPIVQAAGATASQSPTANAVWTPTLTVAPIVVPVASATSTQTATGTPTHTATSIFMATASPTSTQSATETPTATPTESPLPPPPPPSTGNTAPDGLWPINMIWRYDELGGPSLLRFYVHDDRVGESDGDGISSEGVSFRVVKDATQTEVFNSTDSSPGYCIFGGGEAGCNTWLLESDVYYWKPGEPVEYSVDYQIIVRANLITPSPLSTPSPDEEGTETPQLDTEGFWTFFVNFEH